MRILWLVTAATFAAFAPVAAASSSPSAAQVRAAVHTATRSRDLWATVNICNTARHPGVMGIRAEMPSLGFTTTLVMSFQVDYWNYGRSRFVPDPGVEKTVVVGRGTHALHQSGAMFTFQPPVILSGTVTFEWRLGSKAIGRATRLTAHGIKRVDFGDPAGYSAATCRMS